MIENDQLDVLLGALPPEDMRPALARRTRDRAVSVLLSRRERRFSWTGALYRKVLEPVLVGGLSLGFLIWAVSRSIEVLRSGPRLLP